MLSRLPRLAVGSPSQEISKATWTWPRYPVLGVPIGDGVGPDRLRCLARLSQSGTL